MRHIILILALVWAQSAQAGAWMRKEGTGFGAVSVTLGQQGKSDSSLFIEYGVRPKLTLGLKADVTLTQGILSSGSAYIFARRPINTGQRPFKLAYEIGLGAHRDIETQGIVTAGLSYGRGFALADKSGWVAVDLKLELAEGENANKVKLDSTVGLSLNKKSKIMMQVFIDAREGRTETTLAPSFIWQPQPKKPSYQFGVETKAGVVSLRLGLWKDF